MKTPINHKYLCICIFEEAMQLAQSHKYAVWFGFEGHVNMFSIRIGKTRKLWRKKIYSGHLLTDFSDSKELLLKCSDILEELLATNKMKTPILIPNYDLVKKMFGLVLKINENTPCAAWFDIDNFTYSFSVKVAVSKEDYQNKIYKKSLFLDSENVDEILSMEIETLQAILKEHS